MFNLKEQKIYNNNNNNNNNHFCERWESFISFYLIPFQSLFSAPPQHVYTQTECK